MTFIIKQFEIKIFLSFTLLMTYISYAQNNSDSTMRKYFDELSVNKLIATNECTYAFLDTINSYWKNSCLNDVPCLAIINRKALSKWEVQILQRSFSNYLYLKELSVEVLGALNYQDKLYLLRCHDSLDLPYIKKYFTQVTDSIKILSSFQTFVNESLEYNAIKDTMWSTENNVMDWEILTYDKSINLICEENDTCFRCKEILRGKGNHN